MQTRRQSVVARIDPRLRTRLRVLFVISAVMLVIVVADMLTGRLNPLLALLGVAAGLLIGVLVSRMFRLSWQEETGSVVSRIDWVGAVILIAYVLFSVFRNRLLGSWIHGAGQVAATGLAISAGVMLGRVIGMRFGIRRLLSVWVPEVLVRPADRD